MRQRNRKMRVAIRPLSEDLMVLSVRAVTHGMSQNWEERG